MKINIALLIVMGIIIIGGSTLLLSGKGTEAVSTSTLLVDREIHDFGDINIFSGVVTTKFALTNEGPDDIVINEGTTSCGCTDAEIGGIGFGMHEKMSKDFVILAGETKDLTVIYDPLAHGPSGTGLAQRSVFLKTNSSVTPELEVRIKATVTKSKQ